MLLTKKKFSTSEQDETRGELRGRCGGHRGKGGEVDHAPDSQSRLPGVNLVKLFLRH